jgi:hypothetical protein
MTLDEVWKRIEKDGGPSHILMDKDGTTLPTPLALKKNPDLQWDVIYIRNDGWSLGCDFYLSHYAEALHRETWSGVVNRGAKNPRVLDFRLDKKADPPL